MNHFWNGFEKRASYLKPVLYGGGGGAALGGLAGYLVAADDYDAETKDKLIGAAAGAGMGGLGGAGLGALGKFIVGAVKGKKAVPENEVTIPVLGKVDLGKPINIPFLGEVKLNPAQAKKVKEAVESGSKNIDIEKLLKEVGAGIRM